MRKLSVLAVLLLLAACGEPEKESRGIRVLTDMRWSPALPSQGAVEHRDAAGKTELLPSDLAPPAGSVPRPRRGAEAITEPPADPAAWKALPSPLVADRTTLIRGRYHYDIYCTACHGRDGNAAHALLGDRFPGVPSLNGASIRALSDGDLYGIISHGKNGRMPSLAGQILPEDRWAVAHYLRALNRAAQDRAALAEALTAAERAATPDAAQIAELKARLAQADADAARIGQVERAAADGFRPPPPPTWKPRSWDDGLGKDANSGKH